MKILLISVPLLDEINGNLIPIAMDAKKVAPPYGIYLLSSILKLNGHNVDIADLIAKGNIDLSDYNKRINEYDLIGIGATSFSWPTALQCIREIRKHSKKIPIVLGGVHPSMFDQYILNTTDVDYIIRGEGEIAIVELCEMLNGERNIDSVTNISFKNSENKIIRNNIERVVNLSDIPIPDYTSLPHGQYSALSLESSRGCPFDCIFCSTNYRKTYRTLSPITFVDHVEEVLPFLDKVKNQGIQIIDDEFSLKTDRVIAIANELTRRKLNIKFVFDARARDLLNEEFIEAIAPYTSRLLIGAECGYNSGLKRVGKKITIDVLENAAKNLKKFGLSNLCDCSFVIGFPWETYDDALKTINFASELMIKYDVNILLQWYLQIPGSRLWQKQKEKGVVSEALYDEYGLFRNPYLFRTGVNFSLKEFNKITEIVTSIRMLHEMSGVKNSNKIDYAHPLALRRYFPQDSDFICDVSGLNSLREISRSISN